MRVNFFCRCGGIFESRTNIAAYLHPALMEHYRVPMLFPKSFDYSVRP
jgi:hypothetical protein